MGAGTRFQLSVFDITISFLWHIEQLPISPGRCDGFVNGKWVKNMTDAKRNLAANPVRAALRVVAIVAAAVLTVIGVIDASRSTEGASVRSALTLIAPAKAGGGWDGLAREMQQSLRAEGIVNNAQVVNIPGAGGTIGLSQLTQMNGDPNTLMVMGVVMLGAIRVNGSGVDLGDVTPIARLTDDYDVVVVPADSPYNSMDDLVADWRKDSGKFAFGGGSLGSLDQMIIAQTATEAGIDPAAVNYLAHSGGAELATALLSGTISASVSGYADFEDQIDAGRLKVLAVSAPEKVDYVDAPTLIEEGYNVSLTNWRGVMAPPELTEEQVAELEEIMSELVASPTWRETLSRNNWEDSFLVGDDFAGNLAEETARVDAIWSELGY